MHSSILLALASSALIGSATAAGAVQGFNCGNKKAGGLIKVEADYEKEFKAYHNLAGIDGSFTSARLYTMIQGTTKDDPIEAIPAALKTKTSLLLGMWCSGDPKGFVNELNALKKALDTYPDMIDIVDGISVGSEDLYRDSEMGQKNKAGLGIGPAVLADYIKQVREVIASHSSKKVNKVKVGHVDTWTAWVNGTNKEIIDSCDWVGFDAYPYWQATMPNNISVAGSLFFDAMDKTKDVAGSKEVWVTETGWPVKGNVSNLATADVNTAELFYKGVGCRILGTTPTWYYILTEEGASPDFSVADSSYKPLFDLSCKDAKNYSPLLKASENVSKSNSTDSDSDSGSGSNSGSGSSASGGAQSESSTTNGATPSGTGNPNGASTQHFNCFFALILAGIVAFSI
jgi:glucan endo-1,3-beta-D-glucosidase